MAPRGRPRAFDRDAALDAAMQVFWRKGYTASSLAELCAAMEINPPSLYAAFGSKDALYEQALARYGALAVPAIWGGVDGAPTARDAVESVLLASAANLGCSGRPPGCMVALSSVGEEGEARLGALVREARADGTHRLEARLARAVSEGELPEGLDLPAIARFYSCVVQGLSLQARDGASRAELDGIARSALAAWRELTSLEPVPVLRAEP
ncbi:TetR/AcrR family transcriptional regulator [Aquabacter cavernae]|uniref:TetR/AcrR family transcriptional regulator n=1 Tax=Aquabacter cavernae TaxID=2496029 RepID=UPI000F8C7E4D|nr:TetR/AcrR family transcriptional regulator [Aquabacter cavernae]